MKTYALICAAALGLTGTAALAKPGMGHKDPAAMVNHMEKKLDLTAAQKTKIEGIFKANEAERQRLRDQHEALHNKIQAQINTVLSPEQRAKAEAMKKERQERFEKFGKGGKDAKDKR